MGSSPLRLRQMMRLSVSLTNGLITLVVLLIAPLGLATVLTLTALITATTYLGCLVSDRLLNWLDLPQQPLRTPGLSPATRRLVPMRWRLPRR